MRLTFSTDYSLRLLMSGNYVLDEMYEFHGLCLVKCLWSRTDSFVAGDGAGKQVKHGFSTACPRPGVSAEVIGIRRFRSPSLQSLAF